MGPDSSITSTGVTGVLAAPQTFTHPPPIPPWYRYGSDPHLFPSNSYSSYGYSFPPPWMYSIQPNSSTAESKPFSVKLLNNQIKKCRGCNREFSRKVDGSPPDPPLNMVVSHEERRPFIDAQNVKRASRPQNVYYHCNLACIRANHPSFVGRELQIPLCEHFQVYC